MRLLNRIFTYLTLIGMLCTANLSAHEVISDDERKLQAKYYQGIVFEAKAEERQMLIDSALFFGLQTDDLALIGDLYLTRGTVYYSLKNYQLTLEQYLLAYDYIQRSGDPYGLHSVKNMIANLKNYMGYYQDAEELFKECVSYFGQDESNYNLHRGWMNSMMGLAWSLTKRGELTESVQILSEARDSAERMGFSDLDLHYVIFKQGINAYFNGDFSESVQMISDQLPVLYDNEDFAWASVGELYLGKAHWDQGNQEEAMSYFKKIDELFREHRYTHPDLREAYELMISYYETMGDQDAQLGYIQQLVQVDQVYNENHRFLISTIYKKYTTRDLIISKQLLQTSLYAEKNKTLLLIIFSSLIILTFFIWNYYQKRKTKKIVKDLKQRILSQKAPLETEISNQIKIENIRRVKANTGVRINKEVETDLLNKLKMFEEKEKFLKSNITLENLAKNFKTNTSYLSKVINANKQKTFTQYLNGLRIEYVLNEMTINQDSIFFKYSIKSIAESVGFKNVSVFTRAFKQHVGIKPSVFIREIKMESLV